MTAEITSQFIFDVFVQRKKDFQRDFEDRYLLTQIKLTSPPDFAVAKLMVDHMCDQIMNDVRTIPREEKEDVKVFAKLGLFAYENINTFEQNKSWISKNDL